MIGPLVFEVDGHPAPQGSKTPTRNGGMREANPRTKSWRTTVAWSVKAQLPVGHRPVEGPVLLAAFFTMPRPPKLGPGREFPSKVRAGSGDEDKLTRAVCDSLTRAGAWKDDSQVVRTITGSDFPGAPGFRAAPGVRIVVAPLTSDYLADLFTVWVAEVLEAPVVAQSALL